MKLRRKAVVQALSLAFGGLAIGLPLPGTAQQPPAAPAQPQATQQQFEGVTITGTRLIRRDYEASSPIVTITAEELAAQQDVTLETYLNTLPQINPAGTTTSNNPGNDGQANVDLRGLGTNRNLILIDGRRPMVSASDQTVDLNNIPMAMIESIEIITGGAAAVYGADAVAGVVNIRLKRRFEGVELNAGLSNSLEHSDARERNVSLAWGGNFANNRGNAMMVFDYADRESLIKSQREFAKVATATTSFFPEGTYRPTANNSPSQAAVDALYGQSAYGGIAPGLIPNTSVHGINLDGSLFYPGIFNSPTRNVFNWRYAVDDGVNTSLFPDVYSYNFDAVNILVLPYERRSMMAKFDFDLTRDIELFSRFNYTKYESTSALAPTPVPTVSVANPAGATSTQATSPLVSLGFNSGNQLVVPVTNPFIPADLAALLASRTGDNPQLVGAGATEPFFMRWRTLPIGLRTQDFENQVHQFLAGLRGPLWRTDWRWEAYASEGRTKITSVQSGNVNTQRLQQALEAADGGASLCAGGVNPFGRNPLSPECIQFLEVQTNTSTDFLQQIVQAYVSGDAWQMPAGPATAVLGVESRRFEYDFDPGPAAGPISGFNTQTPDKGTNSFRDFFGELGLPIIRNAPWARALDISLAYRNSASEFRDEVQDIDSPRKTSDAYSLNLNWEVSPQLRARGSLQRSVRAANFGELFSGGSSAPQIFDPCSVTSTARQGPNAAQLAALCANAGTFGGLGTAVTTHVQTPGTQAQIDYAGNRDLDPETGDSATLGLVWQPDFGGHLRGLRASLDYYYIRVKDAIVTADSNEFIADCYNYYGNNPTYDPNYGPCTGLWRFGDILLIEDSTSASGVFLNTNGGKIQTSGIDSQINWGTNIGPGRLNTRLNLNYTLEYKLQSTPQLPYNDFAGTIPYFGAGVGFGQAFPKWRATLFARYHWDQFAVDTRIRYIDGMSNRMGVLFPGEAEFTGVPSTTYVDLGFTWEFIRNAYVRLGVNNVFDQEPRTYRPNVQSGTDPSVYDVIGRRWFVQANMRFQ